MMAKKKLVQELWGFMTVDSGTNGCVGCAFRNNSQNKLKDALCASVACLSSQRKDKRNVQFVVMPHCG